MSNDHLREDWIKPKRWYQEVKGHQAPPTSEGLEQTATLQEDLYRQRLPEGESLPIMMQLVSIADGTPKGEEIMVSVQKLRTGRAGEPSGMKAEHLNTWLREATREKDLETDKWNNWWV